MTADMFLWLYVSSKEDPLTSPSVAVQSQDSLGRVDEGRKNNEIFVDNL